MLRVESHDLVRVLVLDRPERSNALHPALIGRLHEALEQAEGDAELRVVVVTGAGRNFSAGLDLKHLAELDAEGRIEYMGSLFTVFRLLRRLHQPVIAAVNGAAIAGGFDLAAMCDVRVCNTAASFAQAEILLGLTQVSYPLYKAIGLSRATELALTGETITAAEAHRIGLVSSVHEEDELLPHAMQLARKMADRPPEALFETKRLTRDVIQLDTDAAFERMYTAISERLRSAEHHAALTAYMERLKRRSAG